MGMSFKTAERNFKRRYYTRALIAGQGRVSDAALFAGVNRTHFYKMIKILGIDLARIPRRDVYSLKTFATAHREFCRKTIRRILERSNWSPMAAQRLSGINRTHFYRLTYKLGIQWPRVLDVMKGNAAWRELDALPPAATRAKASRPTSSP